jgi:hypothetical protein
MTDSTAVDRLCRGLFDDASLFPPAALAMAPAVAGHLRHTTAWYGAMSGPFVCPDARIGELRSVLTAAGVLAIDLSVVVAGGAAAAGPALAAVAADPRLRLRGAEVPAARAADPVSGVADVAAALDAALPPGAHGYIEIPPADLAGPAGGELTDLVADRGYRAKLRTGGATAAAFPGEPTLAAAIAAATWRRLPFKCTAGLHQAVRNTDSAAGFDQHGFLNVLLAVGAGLSGAGQDELAAVLALRDTAGVAARVRALDTEQADEIRGIFASFGTCSTDEPVADLVSLGLAGKDGR